MNQESGLPVDLGGGWSLEMHEIAWFQGLNDGPCDERYRIVRLAISHGCSGPDGPRAVVANQGHCARCMAVVPGDVSERALWHSRRLGHMLLGYQVMVLPGAVVGP